MPRTSHHKIGWANRVTLARIFFIAPFVLCLLNQNNADQLWLRWVAIAIFAVMAISDGVDGYLARRLHDESPLGAFLDPLADKLLITLAVVLLCINGVTDHHASGELRTLQLPNWVVVAAIGKDLIVSLGFVVIYMSTHTLLIKPRWLGKTCTTVEMLLVLSMLLWPSLPSALSEAPRILWIATTILAALSAVDYIRSGNHYIISTNAAKKTE
ncbi:MAG: CDP-alcohol phosphatidyltransferase family protein [Planctomycetes bacterium]|nr:CDP-alcohol phosphatidyltransferase family protein [Planctomycetota bacterium]